MSTDRVRLPVSTRRAFALAFDLAVRRDPGHSLLVPLLLQAPWILALASLPPIGQTDRPVRVMLVWMAAQLGSFLIWLTVSSMLRFRARSVFNTPLEMCPAPVGECYALGLRRVPWLLVTEIVRNLALIVAALPFGFPALFLGFRLAFATEAVVLREPSLASAFRSSFRLTRGRFERWLEMVAVSVAIVCAVMFLGAAFSLVFPGPGFNIWVAATQLAITALMPIIQYAWTFFYLRLAESEESDHGSEVGPAYAAAERVPSEAASTDPAPTESAPSAPESERTIG